MVRPEFADSHSLMVAVITSSFSNICSRSAVDTPWTTIPYWGL
jgi:hypothetical protein